MPAIVERMVAGERNDRMMVMPGEVAAMEIYDPESEMNSFLLIVCDRFDRTSEVFAFTSGEEDAALEDQDPAELMQFCTDGTQLLEVGHEHEFIITTESTERKVMKLGIIHRLLMSPDFKFPDDAG